MSATAADPWERLQGVRRVLDRRVLHDQAVGMLMHRRGCTADAAARLLAGTAARLRIPEHAVVSALVDSASEAGGSASST